MKLQNGYAMAFPNLQSLTAAIGFCSSTMTRKKRQRRAKRKRCPMCKTSRPASSFDKGQLKCKDCRKRLARGRSRSTETHALKGMLRNANGRHRKRVKTMTGRARQEYVMTLTLAQLREVVARHRDEHGVLRCAYTQMPIHLVGRKTGWLASIERIDQAKSYTKDNVCMVGLLMQCALQWSRAKFIAH